MKVQLSPFERAVNALIRVDGKLSAELEVAVRQSMTRDRELRAQRDELAAALKRIGCQDQGSCGEPHPIFRPDGRCFACAALAKVRP